MSGPRPELGGPAEILISERASATPIAPLRGGSSESLASLAEPVISRERAAKLAAIEAPLHALEAWFSSVVMHPASAEAGVKASAGVLAEYDVRALEQIVTAGPRLSAVERLGLYQYAYHARLVECLADDYPSVKHAIGEQAFDSLARSYIEATPSRSPNLNGYGRHFASFCAARGEHFVAELSRLEWAMVEVLHAQAEPTLSLELLAELPPEKLADIRLPPSATLRLEEFEYPVNRYLQAVRTGGSPELPAREWSATAIYRQGDTIWRMDFTKPMAGVLVALMRGATLGEALSTLDPSSEGDVMIWFREWVAGGFFARVVLESLG